MTVASLFPLGNFTRSGVLSRLGTVSEEEKICWPSRLSIASRKNTAPKAESYNKGRVLTEFRGRRVSPLFPLGTLFPLQRCPAISVYYGSLQLVERRGGYSTFAQLTPPIRTFPHGSTAGVASQDMGLEHLPKVNGILNPSIGRHDRFPHPHHMPSVPHASVKIRTAAC